METKYDYDLVLKKIRDFFIRTIPDGWFNGIVADRLVAPDIDTSKIKPILKELLSQGKISCTFSSYDSNIHIKRLPTLSLEKQFEFLEKCSLNEIGCYPTEAVKVELSECVRTGELDPW